MALNKVLACASSARAAEMLVVPAIAATARMNIDAFAILVNLPNCASHGVLRCCLMVYYL